MYVIENDIPVTVSNVVVNGDTTACDADAGGDTDAGAEPVVTNDPLVTPIRFTSTSTPVGLVFVAVDCDLSIDGTTVCDTPSSVESAQAIYVSNNEINNAGQMVITVSMDTSDAAATGAGFFIHYDSSELTYEEDSQVGPGNYIEGMVYTITDLGNTDWVTTYGADNNTLDGTFTGPEIDEGTGTGTAVRQEIAVVNAHGAIVIGPAYQMDGENIDANVETDSVVNAGWVSFAGNWPGQSSVELVTLIFDIVE
jgi:hypothetical protein